MEDSEHRKQNVWNEQSSVNNRLAILDGDIHESSVLLIEILLRLLVMVCHICRLYHKEIA